MRTQILVAMLALGCGSKDTADSKGEPDMAAKPERPKREAPKPSGTPRPQPKLKVTLDGKPVEMQQALAWQQDGEIRVTVSSVATSCEEVTGSMRRIYDGEVSFDVTLGKTLQPDGSLTSEVKSTYYSGMTSQRSTPAATTGDAAPKSTYTAEVDFTTSGAGADKHELVVKGTIDAIACEPKKSSKPPVALPPEMPATIEVAGKKLPVRGALISTMGKWVSLKLTTGAETCKNWMDKGELSVEVSWKSVEEKEPFQISLGGSLLGPAADQTFDKKKVTVKPTPVVAGDIEVSVDVNVIKYPVKVAGKVTAVQCK